MRDHPTISARVNRELYDELKELKEKADLTVAAVLKVGVGKCAPVVGEAYRKGYITALVDAYETVCLDCEDRILVMCPDPQK